MLSRCHFYWKVGGILIHETDDVEVLVVGGGPAGLLTAAYLAERHRVALIERGDLGETNKYWLTSLRRLEKHGLQACICYRPKSMIVGTFLGGYLKASGDLAVVDDKLLMKMLLERCLSRGALLTGSCSAINLSWTNSHIQVNTTSKSYTTRLVIDASGGLSQIAATFRLHQLDGFFCVYGALLSKIVLHTADAVLGHVEHFGDPPPIFEVFPCGEDAAYCSVFKYSTQLTTPTSLEQIFRTHCHHNPFFVMSDKSETVAAKMGAIPIGRMTRRCLPGILPIGEAGLVQPPLLGSAFNEVLEYGHDVCAHVSALLASTNGIPSEPRYEYPLVKRVQDRLQLRMIRSLLSGNVESFDRIVRILGKLPSETIYDLCSNDLNWTQILLTIARIPLVWRHGD